MKVTLYMADGSENMYDNVMSISGHVEYIRDMPCWYLDINLLHGTQSFSIESVKNMDVWHSDFTWVNAGNKTKPVYFCPLCDYTFEKIVSPGKKLTPLPRFCPGCGHLLRNYIWND